MLDNINLATKAEIQKEIEGLEKQFNEKRKELMESYDKWKEFIQKTDNEMRSLSEYYKNLKKEMDKREGKGSK